ncbi:MAG: S-layer homology domain-containing protein [Candidatus Peregrinibacteria bacterium]
MSRSSFFASIALVFVLFSPPSALAQSFSDVPDSHPYAEAIEYVKAQGIVQGFSDGTFRPDATINRAEFLKIIIETQFKKELKAQAEDVFDSEDCKDTYNFSDVTATDWFVQYTCFAKKKEITKGYSNGFFKPYESITFAEASKIVVNAMVEKTKNGETNDWWVPFTRTLMDKRVIPISLLKKSPEEMITFGDYYYEPKAENLLTRGEMADMIYRLKGEFLPHTKITFPESFGDILYDHGIQFSNLIPKNEWENESGFIAYKGSSFKLSITPLKDFREAKYYNYGYSYIDIGIPFVVKNGEFPRWCKKTEVLSLGGLSYTGCYYNTIGDGGMMKTADAIIGDAVVTINFPPPIRSEHLNTPLQNSVQGIDETKLAETEKAIDEFMGQIKITSTLTSEQVKKEWKRYDKARRQSFLESQKK